MANNLPDFNLWAAAQQAASKYGVDPNVVDAVITQESHYNPNAISPKGAVGLMQLMPGTAQELGVDPRDPMQNIDGGVRYLSQLQKQFGGDRSKMLAGYNFGPGHVQRGDALPPETQNYLASIDKTLAARGANAPTATSQQTLPNFNTWAAQQQQQAPQAEEKSIGGFLGNVVTSGGHLAEGMANAVLHLPDTVTNVGKLALGTAQEAVPSFLKEQFGDQRPVAEGVGRFYKERYGGLSNIGKTAYEDPVGMAADLSALFGVGELALPGKVGEIAGVASRFTNPLNAIAAPARRVGVGIYSGALKPTRSMQKAAGMSSKEFAELGLQRGVNISERGANKAEQLGENVIGKRNAIIADATTGGARVNPMDVVSPSLDNLTAKVAEDATPEAKVAAVNDVRDEFIRKFLEPPPPGQEGPANLRHPLLDEAEKVKERTYQYTPNSAWISDAVPPATREARNAIGGELKTQIEQRTQGYENGRGSVKDLNREYAKLKSLEDAVTYRLEQPGGNMMKLLELIAGSAIGHPIAGLVLPRVLSSPLFARTLYQAPRLSRAAIMPTALANALNDGSR